MVFRGWALVEHGQSEEGIAQLREGLIAYRATGAELESSHWLGLLAEVCRHTGKAEEGLRVVAEAFDHIAQSGIVYYEPELQRLEGESAVVPRSGGCAESRSLLSARSRGRTAATGKIVGTPRRNEPCTPLARPGQGRSKLANCLLRFTGGSLKALTRAI